MGNCCRFPWIAPKSTAEIIIADLEPGPLINHFRSSVMICLIMYERVSIATIG